jgi:hypothetical protein
MGKKIFAGTAVLVVLLAIIGGLSGKKDGDSERANAGAAGVTDANSAAQPASDVGLVPGKSFCIATGIDDLYTGDGHVEFFLTLRNRGDASGTASVIPVRHYDDGAMNMSALDEVETEVPAGTTTKVHTPKYKYKAHEHAIESCGAIVNGGDEVPIQSIGS